MITIALAALLSTVGIQPNAPHLSTARTNDGHVVYATSSTGRPARDSALAHLERARSAQVSGDLVTAEREFSKALWLQRGDGMLAVDASYGVATVLTMQHKYREAADVLDQLAADANLLGDAETEARVLLDVVAVKVKYHRRAAARQDAQRLQVLIGDERISGQTRRMIVSRMI